MTPPPHTQALDLISYSLIFLLENMFFLEQTVGDGDGDDGDGLIDGWTLILPQPPSAGRRPRSMGAHGCPRQGVLGLIKLIYI